MCGILGYTSLKKENIDKFPIKKILNTLKHRGPDSSKYIKMKNCYSMDVILIQRHKI